MIAPLYFVNRAGLRKARSLIAHLRDGGTTDSRVIAAVLFMADGDHLVRYGRPLYGETWYRDTNDLPSVHGVVLSSLAGRRENGGQPLAFEPNVVAKSDLEAVAGALTATREARRLRDAASDGAARRTAYAEIDAQLRASPLWQDGDDGTPFDLLAPIRERLNDDEMSDQKYMIRHATY